MLALSLSLPAGAATPWRLPIGTLLASHRAQPGSRAVEPKQVLLKIHAHRRPQIAHFAFPFGLATDKFGDLFVTNFDANDVVEVTPALKVLPRKISQQVSDPLSVAVDGSADIFVGNSNGTITKYSSKGALLGTITANASYPFGIAVDQFQDVFILTPTGLAIDDASGAQVLASVATGTFYSVTLGDPDVFTFYNNGFFGGNGSLALRGGGLQFAAGPSGSAVAVGSACLVDRCWYDDATNDLLNFSTAGNVLETRLSYSPAGVAYDPLHDRIFVADPADNEIEIYNAKTIAFERSLT